ncbi:zinc-binding dehydrogenase [Microbulbifer flavimaris]|uniref:Zinc-binding dehydrogenase n=1 Tax=Microbulbifer flavimaris TaxID=1781068 RepID=A0ABX4HX08_9GAMM|nr:MULTISPECIES: zinc-binding dehydrogenase [Microbulbifer]KUJ81543.1 zinc-binding dehydrogenase [Microbulbifer sp. ZGT114]PCO04446.1 zinc-binding dehydrogenase [Microbulbifer flavimaris]
MSKTRRVWRTQKAGAISDLRLVEEPLASLAADNVRIDVKSVGLNFADIFALTGLYSATPEGSFIPGLEFAGRVTEIGEKANTDLAVGDRVYGCIRFGGYADCLDVPPQHCRKMPSGWRFAEGAAFPVQSLTAYYALNDLGAVKPGQVVLVHSAAGGVGLQAMRMLRQLGATPIGTVGSAGKRQFLREQGFDEVIVRGPNFASQLKTTLAGRPLHAVLDGIGGKVQKQSFQSLAPTGRLVVFGAAEFTPGDKPNWLKAAWLYLTRPRYDVMEMISSNRSVLAFNLIWLWQEQSLFDALLDGCAGLDLPAPHVGHEFGFEQAHEAVECLRSGGSVGKVVLNVGGR